MKLKIEIDNKYFKSDFHIGFGYKELGLDLDRAGVEKLFQKLLEDNNPFMPGRDYFISIRKDTDCLLDPNVEDCMKYTINIHQIDKLKILNNSGE